MHNLFDDVRSWESVGFWLGRRSVHRFRAEERAQQIVPRRTKKNCQQVIKYVATWGAFAGCAATFEVAVRFQMVEITVVLDTMHLSLFLA